MTDPAVVLWEADPISRVVAFLSAAKDSGTLNVGGVGADNTPPYPAVVLSDPPGGGSGRGIRLVSTVVQVEVLGSPDGSTPRDALKRAAFGVIDLIRSLPEQPYDPNWPVITNASFGTPGWSPMPNGQPRYLFRATLHSHA